MSNLPTSASAAAHFADVKNLFILAELVFLLCLALSIFLVKPLKLTQDPGLALDAAANCGHAFCLDRL